MSNIVDKLKQIKCLICDIDGVLTDGYLYLLNDSNAMKAFHVHDGVGIKLLMHAGIEVAVITNCQTQIIETRMKQLGITHFYKNQFNSKLPSYQKLKDKLNLTDEQFAYIGDDLPDLLVMQQVGFRAAVANATDPIREFCDWQSQKNGGHGAVRELCDFILRTQNKTELALENYLKNEY